jgi:hypothetical protein
MSETTNDYVPGRSLFAEISDLREQMTALKAAMLQLVELQREADKRMLSVNPITSEGGQIDAQTTPH